MRAWNGAAILRDSLGGFAVAAERRGAARPGHEPIETWLSPSEVAEYVYCPEAHRLRPGTEPVETPRQLEGQHGHDDLLARYRRSRALAPVRLALWLAGLVGAAVGLLALTGRLG